jgi:hypothetical protein
MMFEEENRCLFWDLCETPCGKNADFFSVKTHVMYSKYYILKA